MVDMVRDAQNDGGALVIILSLVLYCSTFDFFIEHDFYERPQNRMCETVVRFSDPAPRGRDAHGQFCQERTKRWNCVMSKTFFDSPQYRGHSIDAMRHLSSLL